MSLTREQIAALKAAAEVTQRHHPGWPSETDYLPGGGDDVYWLTLCTPETILALLADRAAAEGPGVEAQRSEEGIARVILEYWPNVALMARAIARGES